MDGLGSRGRTCCRCARRGIAAAFAVGDGAPVQVATSPTSADVEQDPLELLTAGDDLDLATEADLEFYAWVELETTDDGVG